MERQNSSNKTTARVTTHEFYGRLNVVVHLLWKQQDKKLSLFPSCFLFLRRQFFFLPEKADDEKGSRYLKMWMKEALSMWSMGFCFFYSFFLFPLLPLLFFSSSSVGCCDEQSDSKKFAWCLPRDKRRRDKRKLCDEKLQNRIHSLNCCLCWLNCMVFRGYSGRPEKQEGLSLFPFLPFVFTFYTHDFVMLLTKVCFIILFISIRSGSIKISVGKDAKSLIMTNPA